MRIQHRKDFNIINYNDDKQNWASVQTPFNIKRKSLRLRDAFLSAQATVQYPRFLRLCKYIYFVYYIKIYFAIISILV